MILAANVSRLNDSVETFLVKDPSHILMITEAHVTKQRAPDVQNRFLQKGWKSQMTHARANPKSQAGRAAVSSNADPGSASTGGSMVAMRSWLTSAGQWTLSGGHNAGFAEAGLHDVAISFWRSSGLTIMLVAMYLLPQQHGKLDAGCFHRLKYVAKLIEQTKLPYIIYGDWNVDQATLEATGWTALIHGEVVSAGRPSTTSGSEIDYFVVAKAILPAVGTPSVTTGTLDATLRAGAGSPPATQGANDLQVGQATQASSCHGTRHALAGLPAHGRSFSSQMA